MRWFFFLLLLAPATLAVNFPWESVQLSKSDLVGYPDIAFGDATSSNATYHGPRCKVGPVDPEWPTADEWTRFNETLGGSLLKPIPPGAACYPGPNYDAAKCTYLLTTAAFSRFYSDDPLTILTDWAQGGTCVVSPVATGNCTQGGYPVYVVNATTVRDIQLAVNFARNRNIRLVIKNTGHDFGGRSTGAGALSIWTHYLKDFEYIPDYEIDRHRGQVARVSAGIEAWELWNYMDKHNTTMVVPGGDTVGAYGGWIAGGGHNSLSSYYGHGSDQVLAFQVVTADGRYRSVTPHQNADLFFAMLGGGGSTYGVLTSAIVKVYPPTQVTSLPLSFQGVRLYQFFAPTVTDAGGTLYSYVTRITNDSYTFTTTFELPNTSPSQAQALVASLFSALNQIGIPVNNTLPQSTASFAPAARTGAGDMPGNTYFGSRIFPRANWDNETIFNATFAAIRETVEAGYTFHGINHAATDKVAGYPGNTTSISPIWRNGLMHADFFDYSLFAPAAGGFGPAPPTEPQPSFKTGYAKFNSYMDLIRKATPAGGAYYNEGDVQEPGWQAAFFGGNYGRLVQIKRARDPWGLFWAPTMPGSERWVVEVEGKGDGVPSQNGPLCKSGSGWGEEERKE
ncbi:FAD binding domain-containing protein [Bombardia bombarda]|uniref:FAD binding domain-containing protein n=1 Tax=Bombardia bombarda TaxID=252184 RepID=A0AA39WUP1_9PEZI|nr:FAD binding domain-containing protein [Bombardia bombarda]